LTLKREAVCFSETSIDFHRAAWRYIPEDKSLHSHNSYNLKSNNYWSYYWLLNNENIVTWASECRVSININFWENGFEVRQPAAV
jgi:hypothetical protein